MGWLARGWEVFPPEPAVTEWLRTAGPAARAAVRDESLRQLWLRHGGTWFVGVDVLPNGPDGAVAGGPALSGRALDAARAVAGSVPLHRAQVSATWPGYPMRDPEESEAAHRFRRDRDGAHLDGLLPVGPEKRRFLREMHAFVLGIAASEAEEGAAPLVVWEGSHLLIRAAFAEAFAGVPPEDWPDVDVTEVYQATRRAVFADCPRRVVALRPGEAVLLHRHAIHGVAPWVEGARTDPDGRINIYFRPEVARTSDWLDLP
jgi:hypothetical protein